MDDRLQRGRRGLVDDGLVSFVEGVVISAQAIQVDRSTGYQVDGCGPRVVVTENPGHVDFVRGDESNRQ